MLTINSAPLEKGVSLSRGICCGTRYWFGAKRLLGSQSSACRIAFARSQIGSKVMHHLYGHGFPPKLSQSIIRRMSISTSCVQVCTAVAKLRWHHWKADLKSIFDARIGMLGKRRWVVTAQLTIHLIYAPNMHGRSLSILTRLLMDVPDDHSKLWLWVSRSFSTIHPSLSMLFCFWIFIRGSRMPGISLTFASRKGRQ
jgi:hypothetical protein